MKNIKDTAYGLAARFGCCEPFELCEKMGITVLEHELPSGINGFTVRMEGMPFIVLNDSLSGFDRRITCAHELGHIVLHSETNTVDLSINTSFCINKYEREADCFAAHLLMLAEAGELEGMEAVTSESISQITHLPVSVIEEAFFGA